MLEVVHQMGKIQEAPDSRRTNRIEAVVGLDADYTNVRPSPSVKRAKI